MLFRNIGHTLTMRTYSLAKERLEFADRHHEGQSQHNKSRTIGAISGTTMNELRCGEITGLLKVHSAPCVMEQKVDWE